MVAKIFLLGLLASINMYAIEELDSIRHLPAKINPSDTPTLVCFDIDNTLLRPSTHLGSEQWFSDLYNRLKTNGLNMNQILDILLPAYYAVHSDITTEPVEMETHAIIEQLGKQFPIIAITRRSACMLGITMQQLDRHGLLLSSYAPIKRSYAFLGIDQAAYHEGIILCGNNSKGKLLKNFLARTGYLPGRVIFIDDRLDHVMDMSNTCQELGIEFQGFHYTYVEKNIAHTYDHDITHEEYQELYGMPYDFIHMYR